MLSPEQRAVFLELPRFDQLHQLSVYESLRCKGQRDPDLLTAALLHDIGKYHHGRHVQFSDRVLKVMLGHLAPGLLARLASPPPDGRYGGLGLAVHHPEIGAELARQLGCSDRTCWLIQHHEDSDAGPSTHLQALQAADGAC